MKNHILFVIVSLLLCSSLVNAQNSKTSKKGENHPIENKNISSTQESTSTNGEEVFTLVEQMPEFPGGNEALKKYLGDNLVYPKSARENGIQGKVIVSFVVETDGSISEVKVVRSVNAVLDEEAARVVKAMPKWKPGMHNGEVVRVKYLLPISFSLN